MSQRMTSRSTAPHAPGVPPTYLDGNRLWVDSRVRALAQRRIEAPVLRRLGGTVAGGRALELGTGRRGTGMRLALDLFGAGHVDGVELYDASVTACRRRIADLDPRALVALGDATALAAGQASYDAVFCYHLLHHAPDWRAVVAEAARVLAPGGRLYVAEMTARFVDSRLLRAVSHHPADGDRPTADGIAAAVHAAGLQVLGSRVRFAGCWVGLVAARP